MPRPRVATALLVVLLTGCGAPDDASSARETAAPSKPVDVVASAQAEEPAVATAYRAWLRGLAAEDAVAACDVHAPDFTIELRRRAILEDRAALGDRCEDFVAILWEAPDLETEPVGIEVTQQTADDALLAVDFPRRDQTVRMVHRHGGWYVARTVAREGGADRWVTAWCSLDLSMGRDEIVALMGEPSGEYTVANGGDPQLWWARGPYDFRVHLDPGGAVTELVADHDALGAEDRARLDCPELRNRTNS